MKRSRFFYLLLAAAALIYFLKDEKKLIEDKKQLSNLPVKQSIKMNSSDSQKIQNKISTEIKILSNKNASTNMSLQEAYCQLRKLNPKIPLSKNSKFSGYFGPDLLPGKNGDLHTGEPIITMAILDKECPKNKYSVVKARQTNNKWHIEKTLNCKRATDTELFSEYGLQFTLSEVDKTDPTILNLAINGPGLFITSCGNNFVLTRFGKYKLNNEGHFENNKGCLLLNKSLRPIKIHPGDELSEQEPYCFSEPNQCLAILNRDNLPKFKGQLIAPFEFRISSRDQAMLQKRLKAPNHFPSDVFSHYTENLTSKDILPSGISTRSFDSLKEDFECPHTL